MRKGCCVASALREDHKCRRTLKGAIEGGRLHVLDPCGCSDDLAHRIAEEIEELDAPVRDQTFQPLKSHQQEVREQAMTKLSGLKSGLAGSGGCDHYSS